ncbi:hypothetical protein MMC13_002584 [Lambiella insularis]|nr:hypothetical protein [Lambiella insularis]
MASLQNHWIDPPDNINLTAHTVTGDNNIPVWVWGTTHTIQWSTPWEYFNLYLVQDNPPNHEDLILNNATGITTFDWTVSPDTIDLSISRICWFKLHQTLDEGSTYFESAAFNISGSPSWPSSDVPTTAAATSLISTSNSTSAPTSNATSISTWISTPTFATTSATPAPESDAMASHTPSQLVLGIALGISLPLIVACGLFITWNILNKRRIRLSSKAASEHTADSVVKDPPQNAKELEGDSQVQELFSPIWHSELDVDSRWEMPA